MTSPNPTTTNPRSARQQSAARAGLAVGDIIGGKYRIEAPLAEGGMGIVLLATHLDLECQVALKVIRPEHLANDEVIERLLSEARIAASLRSKHVNRVLDVGRTDGGMPYLVLEYMAGCDLCAYVERRGPLPIGEAVDWIMQACEALAEAHAIGIVHRDLKPENLFLSEEADGGFVLKVLDFGISKAPPGSSQRAVTTSPFEIIGSPTYMSPEQLRGLRVDARADIWSLGAVLHELCTGEVLFAASSMSETFAKIVDENHLPGRYGTGTGAGRLHEVVCRCLRRDREERYRDVVELARQLAPLGSDGLQVARVAKVASAARARGVMADGATDGQTEATPLAITRSELSVAEPGDAARSLWRWTLFGAAACVPLVLGLGYLTQADQRAATDAGTNAAPAHESSAALAPRPPSVEPPPSAEPATRVEPLSVAPPTPLEPPSAEPASREPPVRAATQLTAARAWHWPKPVPQQAWEPVSASAMPDPSSPPATPGTAEPDPWDPKTFGGRR